MEDELRLSALDQFTCLGKDCPDNCCHAQWDIQIDAPTHARWQQLENLDLRETLLASIDRHQRDGDTVLLFKRDSAGQCLHLRDGLCGLQSAHGAEMLPDVCRQYPRLYTRTATTDIVSATLSCPEIARLVIRQPGNQSLFHRRATPSDGGADPLSQYMDMLTTNVFDQRKFPLSVRLFYLGKVLARLATLSAAGRLEETALREIDRTWRQDLFDINVAAKHGRLAPSALTSGSFWQAVHQFGVAKQLFIGVEALAPALRDVFEVHESNSAAHYTLVHNTVADYRAQSRSALAPYDQAFENYLRASLLNKGFPLNPVAGNYIATFMYAVVPYATARLILWSKAAEASVVSWEQLERVIYKTERRLGHSTLIYAYLDKQPELLRLDHFVECLLDL